MSFTDNNGDTPRLRELRNYNILRFKMDAGNITKDDIALYKDINFMYGNVQNSHHENVLCRDNTIRGLIASNTKESTFGLKLIELAIIFSNENFYKSLTETDPLTDEQVAIAFNTTVQNVLMKKEYDRVLCKLNEAKSKKLVK